MVNEFVRDDYPQLCKWWLNRGMPIIPYDVLPTYGLIGKDVAAGFLISTDSSVAILDFFISNPVSDRCERDKILDKITRGLIARGKQQGFKVLKADTSIKSIAERAKKHGFECIGRFDSFILKG